MADHKNIINKNKSKKVQDKFKLNDESMISDESVISNRFNEFFVNIGPNLANKIPIQNVSPLQFMDDPTVNSIFLSLVTAEEIREILCSLKNGAAGHDEIKASILKSISSYIIDPLAYICNLSLNEGVFPSEVKIANVLPLYKADDPFLFNNYRPVSLLNVLSKVFEKVMYSRVSEFLETFKILDNFQFGFRKLHSSYMALLTLMDKLISSLEKKEYVIGIFLDFSKAFDTVDHMILLQKLSHSGIRGNALKWFTSNLSNRRQYVSYNGETSMMKGISCGVPQGSILGPLLFLIYINDSCSICKHTTPILFADDTNLFCSGSDVKMLENNINNELSQISLWLKVNKLSLNIKKNHYMVFTKRKTPKFELKLQIDGEDIKEVHKTKFLGVIIDNKLTWKENISYICGKISRGIGMIIKARHYLNKDGLLALYYSFVYPYLMYCNHIWGSTYKTNLKRLAILQNKALRIISYMKPRNSAEPLYKEFNVMKFDNINTYLIGNFMYRYSKEKVPELFYSFFIKNQDIYVHDTRSVQHFHIPCVKTDLGKTGIRYRGAVIWNLILRDGTNIDVSEAVLKKCLKRLITADVFP